MLCRIFHITLLISVLLLPVCGWAEPYRVSGYAELRYGQHKGEEGGQTVLDAHHFTQKYSILVEKKGLLSNGKLGNYDLALGYEWNYVDASRGDDVEIAIDSPLDKILYKGDLTIAPGGLPFNLHAYSYDLTPTTFIEDDLGVFFADYKNMSFGDRSVVDVENTKNIVTGLTLVAGERNGIYSGDYRDILTSLPRILIDFKQVDVQDDGVFSPRDYTDRDLAFISLNKRDNWFHYRAYTHEDHLNPANSLDEHSFLLGNISHTNHREWVDLTNWIQMSSDISYTETMPHSTGNEQKRYDFNLFTRANRTTWRAANYTSYRRIRDDLSLEKVLEVPLYANGELDRNTSWRYRMLFHQNETERYSRNNALETQDGLFTSLRLETFKQSRQILSPYLELEVKTGTEGEGQILRGGVELSSNSAYQAATDSFLQYEATLFKGTSRTGADVSFFEQLLKANLEHDLTSELRAGIGQSVVLGHGDFSADVSDYLYARTESVLSTPDGETSLLYGETTAFIEHRPASRIDNRLEGSLEFLVADDDRRQNLELDHSLNYFGRQWDLRIRNVLFFGDQIGSDSDSSNQFDFQFEHESFIEYKPTRDVRSSLRSRYEYYQFIDGGSINKIDLTQRYEYAFWKNTGLTRKIFDAGEETEYVKYTGDNITDVDDYLSFSLFGNYYVTRSALFGARLRYKLDNLRESNLVAGHLLAELDWAKFKFSLNYSYGKRTEGVALAERTEHRWEAKVKKIF